MKMLAMLIISLCPPVLSAAGDVPTDIGAGPDQTPVQPNIKFSATLKGISTVDFALTGTPSCWLEYSREEMQHTLSMLSFYHRTWEVLGNLHKKFQ